MKWTLRRVRTVVLIVLVLVLSVLAGLAVPSAMMPAYAQGPQPQPYVYPLVKCSGLSLAQLQWAENDFNYTYGLTNGFLEKDPRWELSYLDRVNEFARSFGCPTVFKDNGQLHLWYQIYSPAYSHILRNVPQ